MPTYDGRNALPIKAAPAQPHSGISGQPSATPALGMHRPRNASARKEHGVRSLKSTRAAGWRGRKCVPNASPGSFLRWVLGGTRLQRSHAGPTTIPSALR